MLKCRMVLTGCSYFFKILSKVTTETTDNMKDISVIYVYLISLKGFLTVFRYFKIFIHAFIDIFMYSIHFALHVLYVINPFGFT